VKRLLGICAAAGLMLAQGDGSLSPRPNAADYPAHANAAGVTFAAAAVAPDDVRKMLGGDLYRAGYVVLEVAVYPEPGNQVNLSLGDFTLQTESSNSTVRPSTSDVVSAAVYPGGGPPQVPQRVQVYTESTVGYDSGGYGRRGGVYTGGGVGVGVGNPGSAPPRAGAGKERERNLLEASLSEKGLPMGKIGHAVAGYLYFPKPSSHGKKTDYRLAWAEATEWCGSPCRSLQNS
jgi:hypothetical protein